ncbi:hypothetical protein M422DRAFT_263861 [Sphaerobolus stellatus SS14]|uniref:Uncharacterized protein n=1 Tax=Sphaerobolus stellatus (strain SS14) TaxID=990650 RepID=A0A0C9UGX7_SPHS4|nr:hypothetical protein M422DRAFT_263861 [Sphaerobolus stellatus SS14]
MQMVANVCGVNLEGSISARTATHIVIEALPADDLHLAEAIKDAAGITFSGREGNRLRLSLGVHSTVNHTAETQLSGLQQQIKEVYSTYNCSLEAGESPEDQRTFSRKLTGINTDHASDQKKLARLMEVWKAKSDREL